MPVIILMLLTVGLAAADLLNPTAITVDQHGRYWCANIGEIVLGPAKDNNGFIIEVDAEGQPLAEVVFPAAGDPPLHSPSALVAMGDFLWVADIDRVVVYDLRKYRQHAVIPLREHGVHRISDLCVVGNDLLMSDPDNDQLLLLGNASTGTARNVELVERGGLGRPLAIAYEPTANVLLLAVSPEEDGDPGGLVSYLWGEMLSKRARLAMGSGHWTGVLRDRDGTVMGVNNEGRFCRLVPGEALETLVEGLDRPGHFCVRADGSAALVPELNQHRIRVVALSR